MSLVAHFKDNNLFTIVGEMKYREQLGQGGNSFVLSFAKGARNFAVKFIKHSDTHKLARFVDEYFCVAQIGSHPNIAQQYHLQEIEIEGDRYSIIVMKEYSSSLSKLKSIEALPDSEKSNKGWKLMNCLLNGLQHLHENGIIHRDIKPQNIFYDAANDTYVIGDMGIAHFSDYFEKQAKTEMGERLSNYLYSAPEQYDSKKPPSPNWDIYAVGQVLNWYLYGITIRGDGREEYVGAEKELSILDRIIHRCVQNDPARRFQSVDELRVFEKTRRNPKRDVFEKIYEFDEVVRSSFPKIRDIYETSNPREITRFLTNFGELCDPKEFWWIDSDGGDNTLSKIRPISDGRWLFQDHFEVKIRNLICYRSSGIWQSFFILLLEPDEPFELVDFDGNAIDHKVAAEWNTDYAVLFQDKYMPAEEFQNGHYEYNGEVFKTPPGEALVRYRYMKPNAFMIVPLGTGPDRIDREANTTFLQEAIANGVIDRAKLRKYLYAASNHASSEILYML